MKILMRAPGGRFEEVVIENSLEKLQNLVGGYIEIVRLAEDAALIVNEEGAFKGLNPNFRIGGQLLLGNVLLVGVDGDELTDSPVSAKSAEMYIVGEQDED